MSRFRWEDGVGSCRVVWTVLLAMTLAGGLSPAASAEEALSGAAEEAASQPASDAAAPAPPATADAGGPAAPTSIQDNADIGLDYTLTVDGEVVDSTAGRGPLRYVHGQGQLIPGLERELVGMQAGQSKEITVSPEDGYGPVDPAAFVEVPKEQLPPDLTPAVGVVLRGVNPDGKSFRAAINEVKDASVVLNLNHPLAGKMLHFQITVTDIAPTPVQ